MGLWSKFISFLKTEPTKLFLGKPSSYPLGTTVVIKGRLVKARNMAAIPNATVVVTVTPPSGTAWTANKVTDVNGQFTMSVPLTVVGNYVVKADYAGEANKYKPSSAQTTITAIAAPVATTLTLVASAPSGTVGDTLTINATLTT